MDQTKATPVKSIFDKITGGANLSLLQRKLSLFSQYILPPFRFPSKSAFAALSNEPRWAIEQIENELSSSIEAIHPDALDATFKLQDRGERDLNLVRFQITSGKLRCITHPSFEKETSFFDKLRLKLVSRALQWIHSATPLPDVDFIVSLLDSCDDADLPASIFAFSKRKSEKKILLMPDHEALSGNYYLLKQVEKGIKRFPWSKKKEIAFWRGLTTGGQITEENFLLTPRGTLVALSLQHSDLLDAKFNGLCQTEVSDRILSQFPSCFAPFVSIEDHFRFKYQILIDGNTCAYSRCYWQLFSNCAIFKQNSPHVQWYYSLMRPGEHYLPLEEDLSNLVEQILWAKENPEQTLELIKRANQLANNHLTHIHTLHYFALLIRKYAALQKKTLDFLHISL